MFGAVTVSSGTSSVGTGMGSGACTQVFASPAKIKRSTAPKAEFKNDAGMTSFFSIA
jgi:hypothetical protein